MKRLVLFIDKNNKSATMEYIAGPPDADGSIAGRFVNQTKESLQPFLRPCKEGKLYTFRPGHRYRVTGLKEEGAFELVPDSKP